MTVEQYKNRRRTIVRRVVAMKLREMWRKKLGKPKREQFTFDEDDVHVPGMDAELDDLPESLLL